MTKLWCCVVTASLAAGMLAAARKPKVKDKDVSALDRYIRDAGARGAAASAPSPGSAWSPVSHFTDVTSDLRATQVDDLITIVVAESASAVSTGATKTSRQSDLTSSISKLAGVKSAAGALANLAASSTSAKLDGSGTTSRSTELNTTLTARVTHVLPNGYLVVEGTKHLQVNSEQQEVTVRGMVRPANIAIGNLVRSDHLAQMEVRINGKGVVGDAIRRPFILYRILLGLLPF